VTVIAVGSKIFDNWRDQIPETLLVADGGLTRVHLDEQVDIATPQVVADTGAEQTDGGTIAEQFPRGRAYRLDFPSVESHRNQDKAVAQFLGHRCLAALAAPVRPTP
jgi:hypothetical protein